MINNYKKDIDYVIYLILQENSASSNNNLNSGQKGKRGGINKEYIFLTVNCFKSFCMLASIRSKEIYLCLSKNILEIEDYNI